MQMKTIKISYDFSHFQKICSFQRLTLLGIPLFIFLALIVILYSVNGEGDSAADAAAAAAAVVTPVVVSTPDPLEDVSATEYYVYDDQVS